MLSIRVRKIMTAGLDWWATKNAEFLDRIYRGLESAKLKSIKICK
jgi:hypothetical protein